MTLTVLIVTGSIAAPNSAGFAALLKGCRHTELAVVMTAAAERFVGPDVLRFTGGADHVFTNASADTGPVPNHVLLARSANTVLVYPASADFIGRVAHGLGQDLASNFMLCSHDLHRIVFPSMNAEMWRNPLIQRNLDTLRSAGFIIYPTRDGLAPLPDVAVEYLNTGSSIDP